MWFRRLSNSRGNQKMTEENKGCGKQLISNKGSFSIRLSLKCGDWDLDKREFILCDECKETNLKNDRRM